MKTDHISNEDYNTILKQHLESLKRIRDAATGLAKGMIGSTLYKEDLFFASVLNRSLSLLDGFSVMLTGLPPVFVPTSELVKTVSWHPHSFIGLATS